jgi:hypothetical protein
MLFFVVLAAWLGSVIMSFVNGRRILPATVLLLGTLAVLAIFFLGAGWIGLAILALLSVVTLMANRFDAAT